MDSAIRVDKYSVNRLLMNWITAVALFLIPLFLSLGLAALLIDNNDSDDQDDAKDDTPDQPETDGDLLTGDTDAAPAQPDAPASTVMDDGPNVVIGSNKDEIYFTKGSDDTAAGGPGDDEVFLGDGNDSSFPTFASGDFIPRVDRGDDLIRGGAGDDDIKDRQGANRLYGDTGADGIDARDIAGEAPAPDELYGGYGYDLLVGDAGDTMTGGANADIFVVAQFDGVTDPVTITDMEPGELLVIETGDHSPDTLDVQTAADRSGLEVRLAGELIARINGLTDPNAINIEVTAELPDSFAR